MEAIAAGRREVGQSDRRTIGFCFLAALVEGYDIQSAGSTAPLFQPTFGFSVGQMGWVFSGNTLGLLIGAAVGGWLADRAGRKRVLIAAMVVFGLATLLSAGAQDGDVFIASRVLTGLGLGAALPNLIALVAEAGGVEGRATRVAMITAGIPFGATIVGALLLAMPGIDWRTIFAVGGIAPLVLALGMTQMHESAAFKDTQTRAGGGAIGGPDAGIGAVFGAGKTATTVLLWTSFGLTLIVLYLLLNWLPSLLRSRGFSATDATFASFMFSIGGAAGAVVLGAALRIWSRRLTVSVAYGGMAASAAVLAAVTASPVLTFAAAAAVGFFVVGSQFVLYGLSPTFYPARVRGTGVGAAVAVGRLGAVAGPALAALMLGAGRSVTDVLAALVPVIVVAAGCAYALSLRPVSAE